MTDMKTTMNNKAEKNSWILSINSKEQSEYQHNYFCKCNTKFVLKTSLDNPNPPDVLCPKCGNDYFIDVHEWEGGNKTKIWKQFFWNNEKVHTNSRWSVKLYFMIPVHSPENNLITLKKQDLLTLYLNKDGSSENSQRDLKYKYPVISKYSVFLHGRPQEIKKILVEDSTELMYQFVMENKTKQIAWIDKKEIDKETVDSRLECISYFLKHHYLQELELFHWKMPILQHNLQKYPTQLKMLDYIVQHKDKKAVRKALYVSYANALSVTGYYPYSDFVFSRAIDDQNFLAKLLAIFPAVKQHIFTDETFVNAIKFIIFLKNHYSEKQISKLFLQEMQDEKDHKKALLTWRDTLRMINYQGSFEHLDQYFQKVHLTTGNLHDELIRVLHLASFEKENNSVFIYNKYQNESQIIFENLLFRLPIDKEELSLWAKKLHNCMFGYAREIEDGKSIIYGVFKNNKLVYAVELKAMQIIQALGTSNTIIHNEDMQIIKRWHSEYYIDSFIKQTT